MLLRNLGRGDFEDVTPVTGAGDGCYPLVNWGCGLVDFDNDGHRDMFIGNGHIEDNIDQRDATTCYRCRNIVLRKRASGKFVNVSDPSGWTAMQPAQPPRRGLRRPGQRRRHRRRDPQFPRAADAAAEQVPRAGRRKPLAATAAAGRQNEPRRRGGPRDASRAGDLVLIDEVHSGRGYQSHWGARLHFGLGKHERVDRVEVRWLGGGRDVRKDHAADRLLTLVEGGNSVEASR